jgi:hypothetical protein
VHRIRLTRRLAGILAGLTSALLAFCGAAPAAFASGQPPLPPGWNKHPPLPAHTHTPVTGGMPGWQITLIAAGAALLAAVLAVLIDRARAAGRRATISGASPRTPARPASAAAHIRPEHSVAPH